MVEAQAQRQGVQVGQPGLEHELCIGIGLVDVIPLVAIGPAQVVIGRRGHQRDVGTALGIEHDGVLHVSLVAVRLQVDGKEFRSLVMGLGLPAVSLLINHGQSAVEDVAVTQPVPAALQVDLPHIGLVQEVVMVVVHICQVVLVVGQQIGIEARGQMQVAVGIGFDAAVTVAVQVECHALLILGLEVFHVDLSRDTLIAVAHRRGAL